MKLPRGQIDQFHLMLVVMRPSVDQVSEYHILQKLSSTVSRTVRYYFWVQRENALTDKSEGTYHFIPTKTLENSAP